MEEPKIVLVTCPSLDVARSIAETLIGEKLAGCVNILPVSESVYFWEGKIQHDSEVLMVVKTLPDKMNALEGRIHGLHPYTVPEFVVLSTEHIAPKYRAWLTGYLSS